MRPVSGPRVLRASFQPSLRPDPAQPGWGPACTGEKGARARGWASRAPGEAPTPPPPAEAGEAPTASVPPPTSHRTRRSRLPASSPSAPSATPHVAPGAAPSPPSPPPRPQHARSACSREARRVNGRQTPAHCLRPRALPLVSAGRSGAVIGSACGRQIPTRRRPLRLRGAAAGTGRRRRRVGRLPRPRPSCRRDPAPGRGA